MRFRQVVLLDWFEKPWFLVFVTRKGESWSGFFHTSELANEYADYIAGEEVSETRGRLSRKANGGERIVR